MLSRFAGCRLVPFSQVSRELACRLRSSCVNHFGGRRARMEPRHCVWCSTSARSRPRTPLPLAAELARSILATAPAAGTRCGPCPPRRCQSAAGRPGAEVVTIRTTALGPLPRAASVSRGRPRDSNLRRDGAPIRQDTSALSLLEAFPCVAGQPCTAGRSGGRTNASRRDARDGGRSFADQSAVFGVDDGEDGCQCHRERDALLLHAAISVPGRFG